MTRSVRLPLSLALCGALCALAATAPAALASKAQHGVVLSAGHGTVRLVDSHHRVSDVRVRSARGLKRGAVVAVSDGSAQVTGHARTVSFFGRVVRSSAHGAVLRLADGSTFKLRTGGGGHAARLARGRTVLVTLAAGGRGNVAKAVKQLGGGAPSASGQTSDPGGGGGEVDGVVTDIAADDSSITVDPGDGSGAQTIPVPDASLLDGVNVGDQVAVTTDDGGNATEIDVLDSASSADGSGDGSQQAGDPSGDGGQQTGDTPDTSSDG